METIRENFEQNEHINTETNLKKQKNEEAQKIKERKHRGNRTWINGEEQKQEFGFNKERIKPKPIFKEYNSKTLY